MEWGASWLFTINSYKIKPSTDIPEVSMKKVPLPESDPCCLLGLLFINNLSWNEYIDHIFNWRETGVKTTNDNQDKN